MTHPYHPIACGLHDELQLRVMRGRTVEVRWVDAAGGVVVRDASLADVFSRDGAEFLRLVDGPDIRLDRLLSVDGLPFSSDPC